MSAGKCFLGLAALVAAARFCYLDVVWIEEGYPMAAALEMLRGKVIYRDFWFDKPPLFPAFYAMFGAQLGWRLRLAGTLFVMLCCACAFLLGRAWWGKNEGLGAAALLAFYLTFGVHSAVLALAPDLLLLAPHLLGVYFAVQGRPFAAGIAVGIGMLLNVKAALVFASCLIWQWRRVHWVVLGALCVGLPAHVWLAVEGALPHYLQQVWEWGFLYNSDTPFAHPWQEGLRRTMNWAGFHAPLLLGAAWLWRREWNADNARRLLWVVISLAGVIAGLRFFPRYYFQLLAPFAVIGARGLALMGSKRWILLCLLVVPLARFGPRYLLHAAAEKSRDLVLHEDSRQVAEWLARRGAASVLVWGYRPDVYALSRVPAATPFLDSQPLTGVIADRHLTVSRPSAPELGQANRRKLVAWDPPLIVDGLGLLNPELAITAYADLAHWMARYQEVARTRYSIIYALRAQKGP